MNARRSIKIDTRRASVTARRDTVRQRLSMWRNKCASRISGTRSKSEPSGPRLRRDVAFAASVPPCSGSWNFISLSLSLSRREGRLRHVSTIKSASSARDVPSRDIPSALYRRAVFISRARFAIRERLSRKSEADVSQTRVLRIGI